MGPNQTVAGLILVGTVALCALALAHFTQAYGVGAVAVGVVLGLLVGNLARPGATFSPGIAFATKPLLAIAVALLGLQVAFEDLARLGIPLLLAIGVVSASMVLALGLARWWGVSMGMGTMIGAGTGVCGVAAIAAVRPLLGSRDAETAYAVTSVALLGTIGLVVLPWIQIIWHPLDDWTFGLMTGAGLHSVPQAVGAGFAGAGETGGLAATLVKLTRVALLGPLVLVILLGVRLLGSVSRKASKAPTVPMEVWGFVLVMVVGNILPIPTGIRETALAVSGVLLVAALAAVGLSARFAELRSTGVRPLLLAVTVWSIVVVGLVGVLRFVPV